MEITEIDMNVKRTLIPWYIFRQALNAQPKHGRENWLAFWRFGDYGVAIRQDETRIEDVVRLLFPDEKGEVIHYGIGAASFDHAGILHRGERQRNIARRALVANAIAIGKKRPPRICW
jgi:hypothetical protein